MDQQVFSIKQDYNNEIKKCKISLQIFFFGIFIIFVFTCNNRYLGITEYYYFPVISMIFSSLYLLKNRVTLKVQHYSSIFLLFLMAFNLIRYDSEWNRGVYISYVIFISMFLLITLKKVNRKEINFLINSYIISAFIISLIVIILRKEVDGWSGTYRYTLKFMNQVYIDPNFLGAFINVPAIFSLNRLFVCKKKIYLYIYAFITALIMIAVFLTGSRAAMIALILGCTIVFSYHCRFKNILLGIIILIILGFILYKFLPNGTLERMFFNSYEDKSNAVRLINWQLGLKAFLQRPIIGYGLTSTNTILFDNFGYTHAIHNTYIDFLTQFGIIGAIPFMVIIIKILIITVKRDMRILFAVIVSLLFNSIMIEQNVTITFWIVLIILYLINSYKIDNPMANIEEII